MSRFTKLRYGGPNPNHNAVRATYTASALSPSERAKYRQVGANDWAESNRTTTGVNADMIAQVVNAISAQPWAKWCRQQMIMESLNADLDRRARRQNQAADKKLSDDVWNEMAAQGQDETKKYGADDSDDDKGGDPNAVKMPSLRKLGSDIVGAADDAASTGLKVARGVAPLLKETAAASMAPRAPSRYGRGKVGTEGYARSQAASASWQDYAQHASGRESIALAARDFALSHQCSYEEALTHVGG